MPNALKNTCPILPSPFSSRTHSVVGRCGRHNSPTPSSVMDLVFRRSNALMSRSTQSTHICFGFFAFFSHVVPSPESFHLRSFGLASFVAKPPESRFTAPLCDTLYLHSLHVQYYPMMPEHILFVEKKGYKRVWKRQNSEHSSDIHDFKN